MLEDNEVEFETNHDLIEMLRAEKRSLQETIGPMALDSLNLIEDLHAQQEDLQERLEATTKELDEYKTTFVEAGLALEEEEVEEEVKDE